MSERKLPQPVQRAVELARLGGKLWWGLIPGGVFAVLGVIPLIRGAHHAAWFWLFLAALAFVIVFLSIAYRALTERDAARGTVAQVPPAPIYNLRSGDAYGGGGTGGVAQGPHAYAGGGEGARPTVAPFTVLADASVGMGYPIDEFIREAGFDGRDDPELDRIGKGGDGGGSGADDGPEEGESGGPGFCVITSEGADGKPIKVDVFRLDGRYEIWPKGSGQPTVKRPMTPPPNA